MKRLYEDIVKTEEMRELVMEEKNIGIGKVYRNMEYVSRKVLQRVYSEEALKFPINIREVVKGYGISICETNLNVDAGFQLERVNGYIKGKGNKDWVIYIDNNASESVKRYILAHELSHYFIDLAKKCNSIQEKENEQHCIDPLIPKSWDELFSDILTSFLMFPPALVLDYLSNYAQLLKERNVYPIDGFEWLRVLGQKAQVSSYFTIISYQHIKFYLCDLYNDDRNERVEEGSLIKVYQGFFR